MAAAGPDDSENIPLTAYARRRLAQRGITAGQVGRALEDPARIESSSHAVDRWVHHRTIDGRRLSVVVERPVGGGTAYRVVTAWWNTPRGEER